MPDPQQRLDDPLPMALYGIAFYNLPIVYLFYSRFTLKRYTNLENIRFTLDTCQFKICSQFIQNKRIEGKMSLGQILNYVPNMYAYRKRYQFGGGDSTGTIVYSSYWVY